MAREDEDVEVDTEAVADGGFELTTGVIIVVGWNMRFEGEVLCLCVELCGGGITLGEEAEEEETADGVDPVCCRCGILV